MLDFLTTFEGREQQITDQERRPDFREKEGSIFPKTHPPDLPHFLRKLQVFGHFGRKFLSELDKKADFCEKNVHFGGPLDDDSPARSTSQNYEAV